MLHKGISPYHGAIRVTPPELISGIRPSAAVIETEPPAEDHVKTTVDEAGVPVDAVLNIAGVVRR